MNLKKSDYLVNLIKDFESMTLITKQQHRNATPAIAIKKAVIESIKLPVKDKETIKLGTFKAEAIQEKIAVNKFLDSRELQNLDIKSPTDIIPIYRIYASGYVGKELYSIGMVANRPIVSYKNVKLPPKVDLKAYQDEVYNVEHDVALNSFECCARNQLGVHFAVVNALFMSKEFYEIRQRTQIQYDTNNIFEPLDLHSLTIYPIFAFKAVELIQRYLKLDQTADATNKLMTNRFTAIGVDVDSYLKEVYEKLADLAVSLEDDFLLKKAIQHFKGTNGIPNFTSFATKQLPSEVTPEIVYPDQKLINKYLQDPEATQATWTNVTLLTLWHQWLTGLNEFPSPEVEVYLPENWKDADNKLELMQQALIAYLDQLTAEDTKQEPQLNTELIQTTTEQTVNECKNHTAIDNLVLALTGIAKFDKAEMIHDFLSDEAKEDVGASTLKQRKAAMIAWLNSVKTTEA